MKGASNRKRSENEVEFGVKSPRKEIDFLHAQMEEKLREATKYAKEGNRSLMEYSLSQAKKYAETKRQVGDVERIIEEIFEEGNRSSMECRLLSIVKETTERANLMRLYEKRANEVEQQMGDEMSYVFGEIQAAIKDATKYAKEGHGSRMERELSSAKADLDKITKLFEKRASAIKQQLVRGKAYYLSRMEYWLEQAYQNAIYGDMDGMKQNLKWANEAAWEAEAM